MHPLQTDETVLAKLVRESPIAIVVSTLADGQILDVNASFLALFGYSRDEVIGQTSVGLGLWADPKQRAQLTTTLTAGQPLRNFEAMVRTKSGTERHVLATVTDVEIDNHACLLTQMYDVTADRQVETQFRALVEQLPVITYVHALDAPLPLTYISPQVETMLGYSPSEVLTGQPDFLAMRTHPEDRERVRDMARQTLHSGVPFHAEYRIQARDGRWVWLRDQATLVRDAAGTPLYWQGIMADITEQRQAEEERDRAERRSRELFEDAPVMYVITRNESGNPIIADCNSTFLTALGYERQEVIGRSLAEFYTPESRQALLAGGYATALQGTLPATERQLVAKSGQVLDVLLVARPEVENDPIRPGTRVSFVDVTARKATENALRESEARFRTVVEGAPIGIVMHDAAGKIVLSNEGAQRALGLTEEQLLGRTPIDSAWAAIHEDGSPFSGEEHPAMVSLRTGEPCDDVIMGVQCPEHEFAWLSINSRPLIYEGEAKPFGAVTSFVDLTKRRQLEAELRASEERFRSLVQNSYDIIVVLDAAGTRKYISPSIERLLGYPLTELIGRSPVELIHPDDAPRLQEAIEACLGGAKEIPVFELRFRHRDGTWRDFEAVGTNLLQEPSVAGIVFNSRDITLRKAAQAALRESEERFRSAFGHAPIGMALVAPDGRFTQVNRSLCELVGYTEEELLGKTFPDITHPDDLAGDLELAERLWAGEIDTYQLEKRYIHKDGHVMWVLLTGSAARSGGVAHYAIAQILDITDRRQLEMERAAMLETARDYARRLRDLTEMRADLTAMIAHELRGPVAALRMMTFLLAGGDLSPQDEAEMFAAVKGEIEQLDRLVSDVVAVTAAEREGFPVQLQLVSLAVLLHSAAAYARTALSDAPFTLLPAPEVQVRCDPERISQVLQNLLDNAAKHTPPGTPFELHAHRRGPRIRIEVADRGPGLPAEDVALIFEKFGRGRQAAQRQVSGMGLGLYLSRQIVRAHGSELTVESAPGRGTVFAFELEVVS
jgi:PAS domain S-box-containing protein